ncbi:helix-turn-helix domain-containing protein [Blastococcus sp. TF02-9]|uniref:helix-turn-helix transcriptional regulator n=1 Tax=Blastococcus sp. TF02-09 TaxID=2250576 RepID=UPI001F29F62A|nr:helix-turn-helix domain-containing protein [Blastococcus sp. TF02-9]
MDPATGAPPAQEAARAGVSRLRILELLRSTPAGLGVQELAGRTGLHANTVRFHLDRLVGEGLADRRVEEREEPGRPRLVFTAVEIADPASDRRNYRFLAEMLAGYVLGTAADASSAAVEIGRTWGRHLSARPAPFRRTTEDEAVGCLLELLTEIGFAPEVAAEAPRTLRIPHCPFREVAAEHRDVVCSIHLGLMQGALEEMRAPVTADRLVLFVAPDLCLAHLAPRSGDGAPPPGH